MAMLATHYYAIFLIAVEGLILFFLERKRLRAWLPALLASCVLFIMLVLAARYLATPHAGGDYEGMKLIGLPGMVWGMLTGYTLMPSSSDFHDRGLGRYCPIFPLRPPPSLPYWRSAGRHCNHCQDPHGYCFLAYCWGL